MQRIREAERGMIYEEYSSREGEIVTGLVQRQDPKTRTVYLELARGVEAVLISNEQIPGERYVENQRIKAYVIEVKRTTKGPAIAVSRTHPGLLKRLFELEVPEIHDGTVEIKGIAAGSRLPLEDRGDGPGAERRPRRGLRGQKGSGCRTSSMSCRARRSTWWSGPPIPRCSWPRRSRRPRSRR